MIKKIDHVGIIVKDVEKSTELFRDAMGLPYLRTENLPDWNCKVAFFQVGEAMLELVEPTGEGDGKKFLEERGGGIQHICFEVDDINESFDQMKQSFPLLSDAPKPGAGGSSVFFIDSKSIDNIVLEFMTYNNEEAK